MKLDIRLSKADFLSWFFIITLWYRTLFQGNPVFEFYFDFRSARTIICPTLTILAAHNIHFFWCVANESSPNISPSYEPRYERRERYLQYRSCQTFPLPLALWRNVLTSHARPHFLTFFHKARSECSRGGFVWCMQLFAVREINFTSAWFREHWSNIKHIEHGCFQWIQTLELCEVWQWTDSEPLRCIIHVDLGCLTGKFPDSLIAIVWSQAMLSRDVERQCWLF